MRIGTLRPLHVLLPHPLAAITTARPYVSSLRRLSPLDSLLTEATRSLPVLANVAHASRPNPADAAPRALTYSGTTKPDTTASNTSATSGMVNTPEAPPPAPALPAPVMASASAEPGPADVRHSRGLMRVNH